MINNYDYRYLLDENYFTEAEITSKLTSVYKMCDNFINKMDGFHKHLYIHEEKLVQLVYDYFADIARLKHFHDIQVENEIKQIAYTAFWVLRCEPIQIANNNGEKIFPNQLFALSLMLLECKEKLGENLSKRQIKQLKKYGEKVYYYFRFRHFSQQSIEFALDSLISGMDIGLSAD